MRCDRARYHRCSENGEVAGAACRSLGRNERRARQADIEGKWPRANRGGRPRRCSAKGRQSGKRQMNLRSAIVFLAFAAAVSAEELPRKTKTPRESYPNVDVIYDSVTMSDGKRLRSIITKPRDAKEKLPVIFLTGWLSCDSVEAPADTKDATGLILRGLAQTPGFCLFTIDKPGCGDSEGDCLQTDFDMELARYRATFRALKNYDFIDSDQVYIFGSSNGGRFAPLGPETKAGEAQVRGYITIGGWATTWFEH